MKIGDILWHCDSNRRVWKPRSETVGAEMDYRHQFVPLIIVGENKVSWLLERGFKVNKKTGKGDASSYQFGGRGIFTPEEMEDDIWLWEHRREIIKAIEQTSDVANLKKVAEIVGYSPQS